MAQISLRVDDNVKKMAENVCNAIGISMSAAINIYLKKIGNEQRIPFELSVDPFYSYEHIVELERRISDVKQGRNMHEHELIEVD